MILLSVSFFNFLDFSDFLIGFFCCLIFLVLFVEIKGLLADFFILELKHPPRRSKNSEMIESVINNSQMLDLVPRRTDENNSGIQNSKDNNNKKAEKGKENSQKIAKNLRIQKSNKIRLTFKKFNKLIQNPQKTPQKAHKIH